MGDFDYHSELGGSLCVEFSLAQEMGLFGVQSRSHYVKPYLTIERSGDPKPTLSDGYCKGNSPTKPVFLIRFDKGNGKEKYPRVSRRQINNQRRGAPSRCRHSTVSEDALKLELFLF